MRILVFHGYLLAGTGSNVYNASLAQTLRDQGHEVHLFCQDRHPERYPFVDAAGDWDAGRLSLTAMREGSARCTLYRPDIGTLLPVYVNDRYEGIQARPFSACTEEELDGYVRANVDAVSEVVDRVGADIALANHLVMGPVILARALNGKVPYAVKVHGSALEYTVKPELARFRRFAQEGLAGAGGVLVGSTHTAKSLWAALDEPSELRARTRLGPPGVDVHEFTPRSREQASSALRMLAERLSEEPRAGSDPADAFARDGRLAGEVLTRLDPESQRIVVYVGKLIVSKGVDLLLACWPLVLCEVPDACLVVVGFGAFEPGLGELRALLVAGDLSGVRELAMRGRELEGGRAAPLRHLLSFLDELESDQMSDQRSAYLTAAATLAERTFFTGRLDHRELVDLLPACEAIVVPSTFPEAFGMVAVEGAACGALPVSAAHSGLLEVSSRLARAVPLEAAPWLSFDVDDQAVRCLAERLCGWLGADEQLRSDTREALVRVVRERWSWESVAQGVIAAARGELDDLPEP